MELKRVSGVFIHRRIGNTSEQVFNFNYQIEHKS